MRKLLLIIVLSGILASSCKKEEPCGCSGPPSSLSFTLVDENGKSVVKPNWVHNYRLYYLLHENKIDLDLNYSDSFPKYNYMFYSYDAQRLPNKGVHEFYINYGAEDTDTLWIEAEKIDGNWVYNTKSLKFNGQPMQADSTNGIYLLRKL